MNIEQIKQQLMQMTPEEMAELIVAIRKQNPALADEIIRVFEQHKNK